MMIKSKKILPVLLVALSLCGVPKLASAASDAPHAPKQEWSFSGMFGTYDRASLQRGFKVYQNVCSACHAMKHLSYRNLDGLGYNEAQIKSIASNYSVSDGPNEEGEMFDRAAMPSDRFVSPYPNENAAKFANAGALPPDLSLITKARHDGSNYVHGILTGYSAPEHGTEVPEGKYYNKYFPGHVISMAPPLSNDIVPYEDETPQTTDQYAADVSHFLTWAADPYMEDRKRIGLRVIIFLLVFAGIMYAYKRRLWSDLH